MKLLTSTEYKQLLENGQKFKWSDPDRKPVVQLSTTDGTCFWYISAILNSEKAYGVTKLCGQEPQLGFISPKFIFELAAYLKTGIEKAETSFRYSLNAYYIFCTYEHMIQQLENGF